MIPGISETTWRRWSIPLHARGRLPGVAEPRRHPGGKVCRLGGNHSNHAGLRNGGTAEHGGDPSFHGFLREYMETSRKLLKLLQTSDLPCAYQWVYREECNPDGYDCFHGGPCETYEVCVKAAMDAIESQRWMPENTPLSLEIIQAGPGNDSIHAFLNREGAPLSVGCCGGILSQQEQEVLWAFSGMWFDFPTPFQRGDILIQKAPPYLHVQRPCDSLRRYFVFGEPRPLG